MMLHCPKMVYSVSVVPNLPFDLVFKIEDLRYIHLSSVWGDGVGLDPGLPHMDIKIHR